MLETGELRLFKRGHTQCGVGRRYLGRYSKIFIRPGAKVHVFAPSAAKRSCRIARCINTITPARRAGDDAIARSESVRGCEAFVQGRTHEHRVSSKAQSSALECSLSSCSWRIIRMETMRRFPLISGMAFNAGSSDKRSNWNVRPCGKFC